MTQDEHGDWMNEYLADDGEAYSVDSETEGATLGIGVWRIK